MKTSPENFATIIAQEKAVDTVRRWLRRAGVCPHFSGVADALVVAGPPASGKKLLVLETIRLLGRERLHLHMGEFAFADDLDRLLGDDGVLTAWIAAHPDGCVVFEGTPGPLSWIFPGWGQSGSQNGWFYRRTSGASKCGRYLGGFRGCAQVGWVRGTGVLAPYQGRC